MFKPQIAAFPVLLKLPCGYEPRLGGQGFGRERKDFEIEITQGDLY